MKKPTKARRAKKTETVDLYQKVTDRIVEALEKGVAPTAVLTFCFSGLRPKRRGTKRIAG
ncbi:hypothetical protein [Duffyella gerundensis]|uniref:hypothetical protein n=1 Tax=Duffyella gerundensis TaxID=1619313 RepID=UPI001CE27AFA|nr:hypothetical protein [Duffyella gerundensis]